MLSGRGLGITGGTLDKLESVPGLTTALAPSRIIAQVQSTGVAMAGQTDTMVPADKKLYSLRDVTGTVPSIPLITASILSKKLAEGLQALIMDVKFGSGAFMATREEGRQLAGCIVSLARDCGVNARALLSDMSTPLGRAAGNWLEIKEAVGCLEGAGPEDLRGLVIECAAHLLVQTCRVAGLTQGRAGAAAVLASGEPMRKWEEMLATQGADMDAYHRKLREDHVAPAVLELKASRAGYISRCDARVVGEVIRDLGGGRMTKDTVIQPDVGVDALAKPGDELKAGAVLCRIHARTASEAAEAALRLQRAFEWGDEPPVCPTPGELETVV
jgi:pyrimidine-nucleoside phosphorylase